MSTPFKPSFLDPLDRPYNRYTSHCNGRNIYNKLVTWELSVNDLKVVLSNSQDAVYELGKLTKLVCRCSLAFLNFITPYIIIEYQDGEVVLYEVNLHLGEMNSVDLSFDTLTSVSITYNKAISRDGLIVAAIGPDGVYRGTLINGKLTLTKISSLDNPTHFRIHRFGLNTANALSIELVELANESI